jgi:hypothetical protein
MARLMAWAFTLGFAVVAILGVLLALQDWGGQPDYVGLGVLTLFVAVSAGVATAVVAGLVLLVWRGFMTSLRASHSILWPF